MTLLEKAKLGKITPEIEKVAEEEGVSKKFVREALANGEIVIPSNSKHSASGGLTHFIGIGKGLRTKVNSNIGSSSDCIDFELEKRKAKISESAGADTIMDLSTGGDLQKFRQTIRANFKGPLGTVPIYEAAITTTRKKDGIIFMTPDDIFNTIESHAKDGVDFVTVHCGVTLSAFKCLKQEGRVTDVVSRGGAFLLTWMLANEKENPLYEYFDRLLEIAHKYDLTLSLGDGFRPGSIADSTDSAQVQELIILGELKERANSKGVQVMIEGPGHIPVNEVSANVILEKKLCHNAPFYVLGPVVTDIAPGYDEITSAIGGAIISAAGADFLCYVTPSEHIGLPNLEEVRRGVIATRIAAHAGDIAKGVKGAKEWDLEMSKARKNLNWEKQISLSIDPNLFKKARGKRVPKEPEVCTMCGKYCAIKLVDQALKKHK
ncbi:phosphomethylpyrimidine synthase ThiC [candidate division WOR-3 bacterium]|nr:phosphomethylpyrimidine synthase ThiC [candidate division WOR-3 bacterium]